MALSPRLVYAGSNLINIDHLDCVELVSVSGKLPSASKVVVGGYALDLTPDETGEFLKFLENMGIMPSDEPPTISVI